MAKKEGYITRDGYKDLYEAEQKQNEELVLDMTGKTSKNDELEVHIKKLESELLKAKVADVPAKPAKKAKASGITSNEIDGIKDLAYGLRPALPKSLRDQFNKLISQLDLLKKKL